MLSLLSNLLQQFFPSAVTENARLLLFFGSLSYVLLSLHWIVSTDWEAKFHYASMILATTGLFYLHYSQAVLVQEYEIIFVNLWCIFMVYHVSTWKNNYQRLRGELNSIASLRPYQGSLFQYLITLPRHKTSSNQWESPPFRNAIHVILIAMYGFLLLLHLLPFVPPCRSLCCQYNYIIDNFERQSVSSNFCAGPVRIAFTGSWSTGKTTIINALLGHNYSLSQIAPSPTTDKFTCLTMGAPYSGPIQSEDYAQRQNCEMMGHVQDLTQKLCSSEDSGGGGGSGRLANAVDVADINTEFKGFVFFDMPGWQNEYYNNCAYYTFYQQLLDKMDFVYVVWDLHHGKIEEEFAKFFHNKARGTHYEIIYNRFNNNNENRGNGGATDSMAFLNQQYAKLSNGAQELLSELYTVKVHDSSFPEEFEENIVHLRTKIRSVNQTVHDNRKILMKENLLQVRDRMTGLLSLRKLKMNDRLVHEGLNVHKKPNLSWFRSLGIEL